MAPIDQLRLDRARSALREAGLDALVCRLPENVLLLSGYWPMSGFSLLVFPTEADPVLIAPESEADLAADSWVEDVRTFPWALVDSPDPHTSIGKLLAQAAADRGLRGKRLGYGASFEFVAAPYVCAEPSIMSQVSERLVRQGMSDDLVDATDLLHGLRAIKTPQEIAKLRLANEIAAMGLQAFADNVVPGKSEIEIAAAVETAIAVGGTDYKGVRATRGFAWVLSGPNAAVSYRPYLRSSQRRLLEGDMAVLELATVADGWWSDLTRTRVAGRARAEDQARWDAIVAAQHADIAAMRHGLPSYLADKPGRDILTNAGLGDYFIHHTGHGIGARYHEPTPFIHPDVTDPLAAGMVTSVEPGIYIEGWGGMRCEDNVLVTEDGAESLSRFSQRLTG